MQRIPPIQRPSRTALGLSVLAAIFSLCLFAANASATVMKYAGLEKLVEISDVIVHATVLGQKTYFDESQKIVVTDTTFSVKHIFAGKIANTVTITQWGGTLDGVTHSVAGDAHFEKGEEVIVFIHRGPDGVVSLSAMGQAKYAVATTDAGKIVTRDLSDIAFVIDPPSPVSSGKSEGRLIVELPEETRSYESFVAELEALVAGIKGGANE